MNAIVLGSMLENAELVQKGISGLTLSFVQSFEEMCLKEGDVYFILTDNWERNMLIDLPSKPIFLNSVTKTLKNLQLPPNVCRINGWPTFISRSVWEVCGDEKMIEEIFVPNGVRYVIVKDEPGFVAARIIAMLVNEAYYLLEDKISTRDEINIAMKLGTNYPYGPFEWASKIGEGKIFNLLQQLAKTSQKYQPATTLYDTNYNVKN